MSHKFLSSHATKFSSIDGGKLFDVDDVMEFELSYSPIQPVFDVSDSPAKGIFVKDINKIC